MEGAQTRDSGGSDGLVVVTGVFDLLHVGHIRFFQEARRLGGELLVGIESDERVRRWKGPERPIQSQDDRAEIVAALRAVDRVLIIAGDRVDPGYYVELFQPLGVRYLAVTADDPLLNVKREAMAAIGIALCVVTPRIENYSTSRLVRRLGFA